MMDWNEQCEAMEQTHPGLHDFLETWGKHCGAPRSVFRGHLCKLILEVLGKRPSDVPRPPEDGWMKGEKSMPVTAPATSMQADKERHIYFLAASGFTYHFPPRSGSVNSTRQDAPGE